MRKTTYSGHVRQEYIDVVLRLVPPKATVNLASDNDSVHLSIKVTFKNSRELKRFQKDVVPYKSRMA